MMHGFREITIGGVFVAPFLAYGIVTLGIFFALRPVLRWLRVDRLFASPPIAGLGLYVIILGALVVFT
jgi:hypothetical protein